MKTLAPCRNCRRPGERGSAVIVILCLLTLVLAYVGYNASTLHSLGRSVQRLEYKQLRRLQTARLSTNAVSVLVPRSSTEAPSTPPNGSDNDR
jgi:hypothetical protein